MKPGSPFDRLRIVRLLLVTLALLPRAIFALDTTLVAAGSVWRYRDDGSNQGTAWRAAAFNDSSWSSGPAQLGYGDDDEQTVVSYGPNALNKYPTTYFRRSFNVANPGAFNSLKLRTVRDDGVIVYINGTEVWRSNMTDPVNYQTWATTAVGADENTFLPGTLDPSVLVAGTNVIAAEIHQSDGSSSDISFDLELLGSTDPPLANLTRGPYLQMGTPTSIRVRWRTDIPTDSRVQYGTSFGALTAVADDPTSTTEHEVLLVGLTPRTRYYYAVGSTTQVVDGGDSSHTFVTSPTRGSSAPTRIWVIGDSGTANASAAAVRDAYLTFAGSTQTNLFLMLGDNAYDSGSDSDYQHAVFDMYPSILRTSVLWPTIGNHDTNEVPIAPPSLPYFAMFSLPTAGEVGGLASGTEKYYSFDYANIHFVCLDSMVSSRATTGPMLTWLRNDLESTSQPWIIAFFHHPPYSKGSHDSDVDVELREMRQNALPILEDYGVDLVLSGHSHSYERSFLIDSHYGVSSTFVSSMKKDGGSGRPSGSGAYVKPSAGAAPHEGAVYVVAGSSGTTSGGALNHPAMFIGLNNLGSLVLDVDDRRLDAKFLRETGAVADNFTILKGFVAAPTTLTATAVSSTRVDLQWTDNATNEDGFRIERCTGTTTACDANPTAYAQIAEIGANAASYSDTAAVPATTYSYRVRAYDGSLVSTYSNSAEAVTPIAPGAPTTLAASAASASQINLTWTDNASNETGFRIERCTGTAAACDASPAGFAQIAQVAANVTSYANTGLTAGTTYSYRVRAFNDAETSSYSNTAAATTLAPPNPPRSLNANPISSSRVDLTWIDDANDEAGFRVERCTGTTAACDANPASFAQIAQFGANVTAYADTTVSGGTTYSYRVRAFSANGNSAFSTSAQATTPIAPAAPSSLAVTAVSASQINLTWVDNASNENGFRIERCTGTAAACSASPAGFAQIAQVAANVTSYANTGLAASTTYSYRVRAFNGAESSAYSNVAAATTDAPCTAPAPTIIMQPSSSMIASGSTTTLRVIAIGSAPLTYQWYLGVSGATSQPLAGETRPTLTISPATSSSYWVRVTSGCASADSFTATVTLGAGS